MSDFEDKLKGMAFELWKQTFWGSPIEQKMGVALASMATLPDFMPMVLPNNKQPLEDVEKQANTIATHEGCAVVAIFPQKSIERYRLDFLIVMAIPSRGLFKIGVECDGHDFHEKTREQAARDKKRDRYLTSKGISMLRFTGSEINRDPFGCAMEALSLPMGIA